MADTSALTLKEDPSIFKIIYGNKGLMTGLVILAVLSLIALFGPIFTESPTSINPMVRIKQTLWVEIYLQGLFGVAEYHFQLVWRLP